jgi:putative FmdB family regulatory protein
MPLYDYECEDCGEVDEFYYKISEKPASVPCSCGGSYTPLLSPVFLGNAVPIVSQAFDRTFSSVKEMEQFAAGRNLQVLSADDPNWKVRKDAVREKCERNAKKQGYTDYEEKQKTLRAKKGLAPK